VGTIEAGLETLPCPEVVAHKTGEALRSEAFIAAAELSVTTVLRRKIK
jgi:hypothetical protein